MRGSSSALASLAAALIGACSSSGSGNATDAGMTTTTILVGTPCKATSECGTDPRARFAGPPSAAKPPRRTRCIRSYIACERDAAASR